MPRKNRFIVPHTAHHVTQRGNYQQYIFESDEDFRSYLYLMNEYALKLLVKIHAFCLMHNHVHFILSPENQYALSELFRNVHTRFSQYKNFQKRRLGHLWQGRFYSCILSPAHLLRAIRYVEMNPVRAQIVKKPWDYLWSSARQHLGMESSPIIQTYFRDIALNPKEWKDFLLVEEDDEFYNAIRNKTQKGLAIGESNFISRLEKDWSISLREISRGRPKKV